MKNFFIDNDLGTAVNDLVDAIQNIMLGSREGVVIDDAVKALIQNWNDGIDKVEGDQPIDEAAELVNWEKYREFLKV